MATKKPHSTPDRFIRRKEVVQLTTLPPSTLTRLINKGLFPKQYKLSERSAAWKLSEVIHWMDSKANQT
jgi:predicted DNA-binding transcriptional regulator AlpA